MVENTVVAQRDLMVFFLITMDCNEIKAMSRDASVIVAIIL